MTKCLHSNLVVKDATAFKRSRFASRFPSLQIDVFEREVYMTDEPVDEDINKFLKDVARHAEAKSWIKVNDLDERVTFVYVFSGDGSFVAESIEYEPDDDPDEFLPDDIESVTTHDDVSPSDGGKGEYI
jgi:hypothetical protein